jgi:hypothetical protein
MPTTSKTVANLSPVGKDVGLHAHLRALAIKAIPSLGEGAKPKDLLAGWEAAGLPNSNSGGVTESSALRGEGRGCGCDLTFWE